MNSKLLIVIVIGILVVGGGAWWMMRKNSNSTNSQNSNEIQNSNIGENEKKVEPTNEPTVVASGETKEFTVEGANFKFVPAVMNVKKGDTVKVTFKNKEGFHDFKIDEFDAATNQIGAGDEEEVEFVADKSGTFEYYCSVGQHRKNGMVGKLIVE